MATPLEPQKIESVGVRGLIREAAVYGNLYPEGAVTDVQNFHFDRIGAATVRPGMTALGSTVLASRPCVGLHNAQSGTAISVFSNGSSATIYTFSSGAWGLSLDGGTASVAVRFIDFASYTIAINFAYNTYTSMRFWNAGSSRHWHHTGDPINPQNMWGYAAQVGEAYKSRIYLGGDTSQEGNRSRLFFSSVISSSGKITWSPTVDFVDINPGDGEGITALRRFSLELLVFKPNYTYRFRTSGVDPDPLIKVGTRSQESVIEGKRGLYFHHDSGFYRYSGGYPQEISRPIIDIIEAIPFSQYDDIAAWSDGDHIYWSIGTVSVVETKETVTYKNAVLRYTESSDAWTLYSHGSDVRRGTSFNSGTTLTRIIGNDVGVVATYNSGVNDIGEPIKYRLRTQWYQWGGVSTRKIIQELVAICEKAQGSIFMYKIDENEAWLTIGDLKKLSNYFEKLSIRFHRIKFQITGVCRFEPPIFLGFEVPKGINEGLVQERP